MGAHLDVDVFANDRLVVDARPPSNRRPPPDDAVCYTCEVVHLPSYMLRRVIPLDSMGQRLDGVPYANTNAAVHQRSAWKLQSTSLVRFSEPFAYVAFTELMAANAVTSGSKPGATSTLQRLCTPAKSY